MDQLTVKIIQKAKKSNKVGFQKQLNGLANGCGSVGRAVHSDTRDQQLKSQYWKSIFCQLSLIAEQMKIKKQRPGNASLKKFDWS